MRLKLISALLLCSSLYAQGVSSSVTVNNIKNAIYCADTSVSANTITCSTTKTFAAYATGQAIDVRLANTVTGATTININGLGAKAVTYNGTNALTSALGWVAGATGRLQYDGTRFVMQGIIPAASACPGGSAGQVQFYVSAGVCGGDSNLTWDNATKTLAIGNMFSAIDTALSTPAAPTVTVVGTPGATTWEYSVIAWNLVGHSPGSATTTISNGNATLDSTNKNSVATVAVSSSTSCDVYRITAGGTPSTTGKIGSVACGATLVDTGLAADGFLPSGSGPYTDNTSKGLYLSSTLKKAVQYGVENSVVLGDDLSAFNATGPLGSYYSNSNMFLGYHGDPGNLSQFVTIMSEGSGNSLAALMVAGFRSTGGSRQIGIESYAGSTSTSTVTRAIAYWGNIEVAGSGDITTGEAFSVREGFEDSSGSLINQQGFHCDDLSVATNNFCVYSAVSAGANKWAFYGAGTAASHFGGTIDAAGGSANLGVCWKADGKTLGNGTIAEITAGTCH